VGREPAASRRLVAPSRLVWACVAGESASRPALTAPPTLPAAGTRPFLAPGRGGARRCRPDRPVSRQARLDTASRDRCAEDRFPAAAPARRRSQLDPARSRTSGQDRAAARHAARPAPPRPRHGRRTHQPADVRQSSLAGQSAHAGAPAVALRSSRSSRVTDRDPSKAANGLPPSALSAAPLCQALLGEHIGHRFQTGAAKRGRRGGVALHRDSRSATKIAWLICCSNYSFAI
jgi:hypothetical protein